MPVKDMTGQKFGRWTVLERDGYKSGQAAWKCQCECGTIKTIAGGELRRGKSKSCGCLRRDLGKAKAKFKPGDKIGELTIIEDTGERVKSGDIVWRCSCSCGNENYKIVTNELTRTGDRAKKHCNNPIHSIHDLTNQTHGFLEVLALEKMPQDEDNDTNKVLWRCLCHRCGKETIKRSSDLVSGKIQTCGCGQGFSFGAQKIFNILKENQEVNFNTEYSFDDLKTENNIKMRYDFAYLDNNNNLQALIEFDGQHHFYYQEKGGWNTKEHYEKTKQRDVQKNEYCLTHDIPLYRIPYYDIDNVNSLEDILQDKYLVKSEKM